jgi:hypothetical protein
MCCAHEHVGGHTWTSALGSATPGVLEVAGVADSDANGGVWANGGEAPILS